MGVVNRNDSNKLDANRTVKEISVFVNKCVMFQGVLILLLLKNCFSLLDSADYQPRRGGASFTSIRSHRKVAGNTE